MTPAPGETARPSEETDESPPRFALAHLSDPHVPSRLGGWPTALLNKRVFGYLSWRLRRAAIHRTEVLDALRQDLHRSCPDHLAVTGDVVNISLPQEFRRAGEWLRTLGAPGDVTVVPGNHDAYVHVSWERSWAHWIEFMDSDDGSPRLDTANESAADCWFPVIRRRGPVALIGLSTAHPTAPGRSSGTVGCGQLERLAGDLRDMGREGRFRVVMLHHPPHPAGAPAGKRLRDAHDLQQVIAEHGAELILHGHEHRLRIHDLAGPEGPVPVFGVASASMLPREAQMAAGQYHLHYISRHPEGWAIETHVRSFDAHHHQFVETHRLHRVLQRALPETNTHAEFQGLRSPASRSSPGSTPAGAV